MTYDSENSQNTIQTQEQAIDESNNSKDTQYNQNSNTTSTIRNNNLNNKYLNMSNQEWRNKTRNRLSSSEMQIRDEILNDNYEEITHRKF